jgi:predicted Na+-dependent transporter
MNAISSFYSVSILLQFSGGGFSYCICFEFIQTVLSAVIVPVSVTIVEVEEFMPYSPFVTRGI